MEGKGWDGGARKRKGRKGVFVGEGFEAQRGIFRESNVMLLATTPRFFLCSMPLIPSIPPPRTLSSVNYKSHRKTPPVQRI